MSAKAILVGALFLSQPLAPHAAPSDGELAKKISGDTELIEVLEKARVLLKTGLTAGSGYGEVWIRDLNTFIEVALQVNPPEEIRAALLNFFKFQLPNGDIPDGYIKKEHSSVEYKYRRSEVAPDLLAHKNTVETDQETSLVQAARKYVFVTNDREFLNEKIGGRTVLERLKLALEYLKAHRFDQERGLIWGATTADWGDVQPEHAWGVELDESSHRAIDIYDNAMFVLAIDDLIQLLGADSTEIERWRAFRDELKTNIRKHLWDEGSWKFRPHVYLNGSPFSADFDESTIYFSGGTAVAIEAALLERDEIVRSLGRMRENARKAGASSIGLTVYPPYPAGFFKNPAMAPYSYQNGGDWCWFGGRMIQQLIRHGLVREAYEELKPMVSRVRTHGDFYEWWSLDNQPRGSKQYRGSAGVLGKSILMLQAWAEDQRKKQPAIPATIPATVLFDFERELLSQSIKTHDSRAGLVERGTGRVLRVQTGHAQQWPGVTLLAPKGNWDLSKYGTIAVRVRNGGTNAVVIYCRVDNAGADGTTLCVTGSLNLGPGGEGIFRVPLKQHSDGRLEGKLFGMRGYPKQVGGDGTVDPRAITQLLLFVTKPGAPHVFEIDEIRAEGEFASPTVLVTDADPFIPFIDGFGQYRHRDWPGKVHSQADLEKRREEETKSLRAHPAEWNQFGGWANGPQLRQTGFFRTEKHAGKWWLVDPEGRLFWSHGIDCVMMVDTTSVEDRVHWFQDFPGALPEFAEFMSGSSPLKGHYAGRSVQTFNFAGANLKRKYGPQNGSDWRRAYSDVVHRRLRNWGVNTIGNWSDERLRLQNRTPYVDAIGSGSARRIEGSEGYWGKFPDPFDPSFRATLRKNMQSKVEKSAGDPWCIGFFSDNEIAWGDELSLATAALLSSADQPAKRTFIADLKIRYAEIEKLNAVWGSSYGSWAALAESRSAPDERKANRDLEEFYTRIADAYFNTARTVIKEAAPNQLYLGCRFAWVNDRAAAAAAKYSDVVSYNLYQRSVADFHFNGGSDVPLIIGEFHFGALDRGMFHTGLVPVASQEARSQAYADYVNGALRHPQFVGCHWFQYQDQPTTGRVYDEENYQIGFVDIADTPNEGIINASQAVGREMYRMRFNASSVKE